jgi:hypothetical protein
MNGAMFLTIVLVLVVPGGGAGLVLGQEPRAQEAGEPVLTLSPRLRGVLVAEMVGLRTGVAEVAMALTTGEWKKAAAEARRMHDSYIMAQQLSPEEMEELHHALPEEFVVLDEHLHRHAEALAHAADTADAELALFYFGKVTEGCVACHTRFATHTLPGFRLAEPAHAH